MRAAPFIDRFWPKVDVAGEDECWNWNAGKIQAGYGVLARDGHKVYAHRASWEIHNGPIVGGLCVLHKCDNPACVNPRHLELGTQKENMAQMVERGRAVHNPKKGKAHPNSKLSEELVRALLIERPDWQGRIQWAKRHGVAPETVQKVLNRENWKHVVV